MGTNFYLLLLVLPLALGGCSRTVVVDLKNLSDPVAYQDDLIQCKVLADLGYATNTEMAYTLSTSIGGSMVTGGDPITALMSGFLVANVEEDWTKARSLGQCLQGRGYLIQNKAELGMNAKGNCLWKTFNLWPSSECMAKQEAQEKAWVDKWGPTGRK